MDHDLTVKLFPLYQPIPPQPGVTTCLKCHAPFDSPDRPRLRICPNCTRSNESVRLPKTIRPYETDLPGFDSLW